MSLLSKLFGGILGQGRTQKNEGASNTNNITAEHNGGQLPDYRKVIWLHQTTQAAEQGHPDAQFNLGDAFLVGYGVPQDQEKAIEWFTKAANQGHVGAKASLETLKRL
jgi:TPR repeat protein